MINKDPKQRDQAFLEFAKGLGRVCCIHRRTTGVYAPADELHHYGNKGMSEKASDYLVARVCRSCHARVQGKRFLAFVRDGQMDLLAAMQEDSLKMLSQYVAELSEKKSKEPAHHDRCARCDSLCQGDCLATLPHLEFTDNLCARDALIQILSDASNDASRIGNLVEDIMAWSVGRSAKVAEFLIEPMKEIATGTGPIKNNPAIAYQALRRLGVQVEVNLQQGPEARKG
jgi:hypothetical protein